MPKLSKDTVKRGQFMTTGWSPECKGHFVGDQNTDYEQEFAERPAPRRPMVKGLPGDKLAELKKTHETAIAEIARRLDMVRAGLDAVKKAKRR